MKRNFDDFLNAYFEWAHDDFCPDVFHYWTGVSIVAGAMERKCWMPMQGERKEFPNMYIFLISNPGMGKTSAMEKGTLGLMKHMDVTVVPDQVTEAKLIKIMSESSKSFALGNDNLTHSSGFFAAYEASNTLKDIGGDIQACLTNWYDCPDLWRKATIKDGKPIAIHNVGFNVLAGCTFSYLGQLIPPVQIEGGFASRLLYIVHDEIMVRTPSFTTHDAAKNNSVKNMLIEDLSQINKLRGPFMVAPEMLEALQDWFPKNDAKMQACKNMRLQSLLARKSKNVIKLTMSHAMSSGNDMTVGLEHFERALSDVDKLDEYIPKILRMASIDAKEQRGIDAAIMNEIAKYGGVVKSKTLKRALVTSGFTPTAINDHLQYMLNGAGMISLDSDNKFRTLIDPNTHNELIGSVTSGSELKLSDVEHEPTDV